MKTGRELDCLIAEKIFGYHKTEVICGKNDYLKESTVLTRWYMPDDFEIPIASKTQDSEIKDHHMCGKRHLPNYSTDLNDAWLIVDWILNKGFTFSLEKNIKENYWEVRANNFKISIGIVASGKTPELAICKFALRVIENEQ